MNPKNDTPSQHPPTPGDDALRRFMEAQGYHPVSIELDNREHKSWVHNEDGIIAHEAARHWYATIATALRPVEHEDDCETITHPGVN